MVGERSRKTKLSLAPFELKLKIGRDVTIDIHRKTRPNSDVYRKASTLQAAIDDLVVELGGKRDHFYAKPHSPHGK